MRTIDAVEAIAISYDKISISPKKGKTIDIPRGNYDFVLEGIERVRDDTVAMERRTTIFFKEAMICQMDNKTFYCGNNPESIWR